MADHLCLATCLAYFEKLEDVPQRGPFRPLEDGNKFLINSKRELRGPVPPGLIGPGDWIRVTSMGKINYASVVIAREGTIRFQELEFGNAAKEKLYSHFGDLPNNPEDSLWYILMPKNSVFEPGRPKFIRWCSSKEHVAGQRKKAIIRKFKKESEAKEAQALSLYPTRVREMKKRRLQSLWRPTLPASWPTVSDPGVPTDWTSPLSLPRVNFLSLWNRHDRDDNVTFHEETHTYRILGEKSLGSVTGVIHSYCEPFDSDEVIMKMCGGANWPRPGYLRRPPREDVVKSLAITLEPPYRDQLLLALGNKNMDESEVCNIVKDIKRILPPIGYLLEELSLSRSEILQKWQTNSREQATRGTYMHWQIEAFLNRAPIDCTGPELTLFSEFIATLSNHVAYRTEWIIYSEEERLCGSIDFVTKLPDGRVVLFDWKRTKDLPSSYQAFGDRRMQSPLQHLQDCKGICYRLQMNMYRKMLEENYGVVDASMHVVCFHPELGGQPFVDNVPFMDQEVEIIFAERRGLVNEVKRMAAEDMRFKDPLVGTPVEEHRYKDPFAMTDPA